MRVLLGLVLGYVVGAAAGAFLVEMMSTNSHDKAQEVAMTAFFFTGPIGAVVGLLGGIVWALRARQRRPA